MTHTNTIDIQVQPTNETQIYQNKNNAAVIDLGCSDGFYYNGNICKPECGIWTNPNSMTDSTLVRVLTIFTPVIGLFFAILYLLASVTILHKLV